MIDIGLKYLDLLLNIGITLALLAFIWIWVKGYKNDN